MLNKITSLSNYIKIKKLVNGQWSHVKWLNNIIYLETQNNVGTGICII